MYQNQNEILAIKELAVRGKYLLFLFTDLDFYIDRLKTVAIGFNEITNKCNKF